MSEKGEKLTKKQRKALEFRDKNLKTERKAAEEEAKKAEEEAKRIVIDENGVVKKKRKTRRGRGGRPRVGASQGPRFLLFVGNLPFNTTETELQSHFKACEPDIIRIRQEKGFAFLEFSSEREDIQKRMDLALRMHHSMLRDRRINVELTAGGGGNSANRIQKLKSKNEAMDAKRREQIRSEVKEKAAKKAANNTTDNTTNNTTNSTSSKGQIPNVHPARAGLISSSR